MPPSSVPELVLDFLDLRDTLVHLLDLLLECQLDLIKQGLLLPVEGGILQSESLDFRL